LLLSHTSDVKSQIPVNQTSNERWRRVSLEPTHTSVRLECSWQKKAH